MRVALTVLVFLIHKGGFDCVGLHIAFHIACLLVRMRP